jgi:hypothetical protein
MADLVITPDTVTVALSSAEKVGALHGDVSVERSHIVSVEAVADGSSVVHGLRAPGLHVPGGTRLGTWRHDGSKDFVAVRPGQPAVVITLGGDEWTRLVVTVEDPASLAAQLSPAPR